MIVYKISKQLMVPTWYTHPTRLGQVHPLARSQVNSAPSFVHARRQDARMAMTLDTPPQILCAMHDVLAAQERSRILDMVVSVRRWRRSLALC